MRNLLESAVRQFHKDLLARHPEFCSCQRCSDDVVAYVMNHVRPRYATSSTGWALENLDLWSDQTRAELSVAVLEAMRKVAAEPRHTPREGTPVVPG